MDLERRAFIRQLGIFIALLAETRCTLQGVPAATRSSSPRERVRACWLSLDWLAEQGGEGKPPTNPQEGPHRALIATHHAAVVKLVTSGELTTPVAELVDKAFESAANHVWWTASKLMCYAPRAPWEFTPNSSENLFQQMVVLEDLARTREFDDTTLGRVRTTIARDIGLLNLTKAEESRIMAPFSAAPPLGVAPSNFDTVEIELTPDRKAAAEFLVKLILERGS